MPVMVTTRRKGKAAIRVDLVRKKECLHRVARQGEYVEDLQLVDVLNKATMGNHLLRPGLDVGMPRTFMRSKVIAHHGTDSRRGDHCILFRGSSPLCTNVCTNME